LHELDLHIVTAVLVAHDGARWLPETLKALLTQTRPVQRLVAVDTGSQDRGPAVLAEVIGSGNLVTLPATTSYGAALAAGLRHPAASIPLAGSGQDHTIEWIWLLHDDSTPDPRALDRLLHAADADANIAVLGPKLRDWNERRILLEIGFTVDGFGRRETGVERRELDQGQHDGHGLRDVLAVNTAGLLIRRDVWDRLGGIDPELGVFRDDLDLCWRVHAAGHRVVAVSSAVMYHAEASARRLRSYGEVPARRLDRHNALLVLLANLPFGRMLRALARNSIGTLARAAWLMTGKQPQAARDELAALGEVLRGVRRLTRARIARRAGRGAVYRSVRRMMAHRVALRRLGDWLAGVVSGDSFGLHRDRDEDEGPVVPEAGPLRRLLSSPGVSLVLALTLVSIVAERSLIAAGGHFGGGALVPPTGGVAELWKQYLAGWHPTGLGSNAGAPPYLGFLALLSTVLFGKPWLAVAVILLGCVPLAGCTAYIAARTLVPDMYNRVADRRSGGRRIPAAVVRVWLAATWALLPIGMGAVAGGRLGTAVVVVLLPLLGVLVARTLGLPREAVAGMSPARRRSRARQSAWGVAALLTVAMAFAPLTWLLAALGGGLVWTAFGPRDRRADVVIALGLPPLLLLPFSLGLLMHPSRFLLEAGLHRPELVDPALPARSLMLLDPGGPGTPPWWAMAGLAAAAVLALPLRSRRTAVPSGWMLALFGFLAAIFVSWVTIGQGPDAARGWPSVALLFAAGGVLLAATSAMQRAAEVLSGRDWLYRCGGVLIALLAVSAPLAAAGSWMWRGADGPLSRSAADLVPDFIGQTESGSTQARTLVLNRRPGQAAVSYTVLRGTVPTLGESETQTSGKARRRMDDLVGSLAAGHGDGRALARMGVQYVFVSHPERDPLVPVLDAAPDLSRLGRGTGFALWRLVPQGGRLMLIDGTAVTPLRTGVRTASIQIPAGRPGRLLLLAEPADGGWSAPGWHGRTVDGWAQGYDVPAAGGHFTLTHGETSRHTWLVIQGLALLLVVMMALPAGAVEEAPAVRRGRRARGGPRTTRSAASRAAAMADTRDRAAAAAWSGARTAARYGTEALRDVRQRRRDRAADEPPVEEQVPDGPGEEVRS
jgi:GT2 family glycosyltransferase